MDPVNKILLYIQQQKTAGKSVFNLDDMVEALQLNSTVIINTMEELEKLGVVEKSDNRRVAS